MLDGITHVAIKQTVFKQIALKHLYMLHNLLDMVL